MTKAWLITGGSSGLGLSIGRAVLAKGGSVVLTTRDLSKARAAAPDVEENGGKWLKLDFGDSDFEQSVKDAVRQSKIDVIVNNAGYPLVGAVEDCSPDDIRTQYEANFIGPIRLIQATLPFFRERKSGTIVNIGSSVTYATPPALGLYGSTKSALRTMTEALAPEVAHFGVRVLMFEPGRFRTNFGRSDGKFGHPPPGFSDAYKDSAVSHLMQALVNSPPSPGNPDVAAERIYEVVTGTGMGAGEAGTALTRIPLGTDAYEGAVKVSKDWADVAKATEAIATSTDFQE